MSKSRSLEEGMPCFRKSLEARFSRVTSTLSGSARRAAATAKIVSTSGAEKYLSRVSLTEPRLSSHTPTLSFPIKFFNRTVIVRAAEMAFQERKWDHVCKTESREVRAFCTIGKLQVDQNRFVL
jgi:hypothetical protein